jgi:hypothetical protein
MQHEERQLSVLTRHDIIPYAFPIFRDNHNKIDGVILYMTWTILQLTFVSILIMVVSNVSILIALAFNLSPSNFSISSLPIPLFLT